MPKLISAEHVPIDGESHSPVPDRNRPLRLKVADGVATFGLLRYNLECSRFSVIG